MESLFPRCDELGLSLVRTDQGDHNGYDIDEVKAKLGDQFDNFMKGVNVVFSCGHRNWPADHEDENKRGAEVHCVYAADLEKFLEA